MHDVFSIIAIDVYFVVRGQLRQEKGAAEGVLTAIINGDGFLRWKNIN